jgi:hypothetical protein
MLMPNEASLRIISAMSADYSVILLRAWRNPQGVLVRVLTINGERREWVVLGPTELASLLAVLIAELENEAATGTQTED